jgi:HSP20 family protein
MPVFRWGHSWDAFQDIEREMDRLLNSVNFAFHEIRLGWQFPPLNLYELPHEFLVTSQLPGTKSEDLELTLENGVLTIKGRRSESNGVPEDHYRRQERFRGDWQRTISIPDGVSKESLTAEIIDGVLRIHLPKGAQEQARRIPVSEGSD